MKCPRCAAWSRVLETRSQDDGFTIRRRHECANGCEPFHTVQMIEAHFTAAADAGRLEPWPRRRARIAARNARVRRELAKGRQGIHVAAEEGISPSLVSLIAKGRA